MNLEDRDLLEEPEEAEAWIPMVSDGTKKGKPRRISIPGIRRAQDEVNPFAFAVERVPLIVYSGVDAANRASKANPNNLAIKEDTTRQSFDDGYYMFEIQSVDASNPPPVFISAPRFNLSNSSDRIICLGFRLLDRGNYRDYTMTLWRHNATSFRIGFRSKRSGYSGAANQSPQRFFKSIHGYKISIQRKYKEAE